MTPMHQPNQVKRTRSESGSFLGGMSNITQWGYLAWLPVQTLDVWEIHTLNSGSSSSINNTPIPSLWSETLKKAFSPNPNITNLNPIPVNPHFSYLFLPMTLSLLNASFSVYRCHLLPAVCAILNGLNICRRYLFFAHLCCEFYCTTLYEHLSTAAVEY